MFPYHIAPKHPLTTYIQLLDLTTLQNTKCPITHIHQSIARTHNQNPKPKTEPPYHHFARFPLRSTTPYFVTLPPVPLGVEFLNFSLTRVIIDVVGLDNILHILPLLFYKIIKLWLYFINQ
jgi:hypothetical protein